MSRFSLSPISHSSSYLNELNKAQRQVVEFGSGPLLVIAGAGSGKTKTLTFRVARLIEQGMDPQAILLLTFTRKAATEMLKRACFVLDSRCERVSGGTFHAFATQILKEFSAEIGFESGFTILDRTDAEDVIQMLRQSLKLTDKRFPKKNTLMDIFSKSVNTGKSITSICERYYPHFMYCLDEIQSLYQRYFTQKQLMGVMDYDDLLVRFLSLLKEKPSICNLLQTRFKTIMVDEYQDTNSLQADIICLLARDHKNIMVVGDDAQSIYSFRGAHYQNILSFPDLFPGTTIVKLEENYRSTQPILSLTNAVIAPAKDQYCKQLFSQRESLQKPFYIETKTEHEQSEFIAHRMLELSENNNIDLSDMAVLCRSGWHSNELEVSFNRHHIPFQKMGGFKFMQAAHVKDMISFTTLFQNPLDQLSWQRVLSLFKGLGPKSATTIFERFRECNFKLTLETISSFQSKVYYSDLLDFISFFQTGSALSSPEQLVSAVLSFYQPFFKDKFDNFNKRETDLDSVVDIAKRYQDLGSFLTDLSLDPPEQSQLSSEGAGLDDDYCTISTIHSAKGLEWKVVFILSVIDGYLPSFKSLDDPDQIEEERRLLYVAMTRAKDFLYLLKPNMTSGKSFHYQGGFKLLQPSRFLIDQQQLEQFTERCHLIDHQAASVDSQSDEPLLNPDRRKFSF